MDSKTIYYIQMFLPLVLLFFAMWFFLLRPQRKRDNETKLMRNSLQSGDEIVTIGGIVGKVLNVKEDSVVIYCGAGKTKMEFKKWAISEVTKKAEKPVREEKEENVDSLEETQTSKKKIKRLSKKEDANTEE